MKTKMVLLFAIIAIVVVNCFTFVSASNIVAGTSEIYTGTYSARDVDGKFQFYQSEATFQGVGKNAWPSGYTISYTPCTQDYTVAGLSAIFTSANESSARIYYNDGYGYRANYRVGVHTNTGIVDTNFSFYE